MMPTPTVHQYLGAEAFGDMAKEDQSPDLTIFYATNRPGSGPPNDRSYDDGIVDKMQVGKAVVHFGDRHMTWRSLLDLSVFQDRPEEIPLHLDVTTEMATLAGNHKESFAAAINKTLQKRRYKDLTLYVHGARSSFFRACVQGSQFYHFMGREGVLLSFSWPSTGSFFKYKKDVAFAAESVEKFADLVEFLATNTQTEKINILAYSAGAQVVAPGLALLRERHASLSDNALRSKLRIGVAYFAAPDVSFIRFCNTYLPKFYKIVDNTTVTFHKKDGVLALAAIANKESRLGRPDGGELTDEEIVFLKKAAREEQLDAIDMSYSPKKRPANFKDHGYWYTNVWVSSDVILQLFTKERPEKRGLKKIPDSKIWYFPADYPETLKGLVQEAKEGR
jgi:esterase/lipase superfamily enzyme